jgi:hypothetical protein
MAPLNPFFLQGSPSEQRLVQDLINEQLKMYGQDIIYMPRKFIAEKNIIKEVIISKFDDSFRIEAYIANYDGFQGQGDILSKFGVRSTNGVNLIISKERYEDFISPFISGDSDIKIDFRPQEGDLIYLPLDNGLFEIKYVESKTPFYQLNNLYVYELRCELFEYEDEVIDTGIDEVDENIKEFGYIQTLVMVPSNAFSATASISLSSSQIPNPSGFSVREIDLINDGYGYLSPPKIEIDPPPFGGIRATAVAIMTSRYQQNGNSIEKILITNPGIGYTTHPLVVIKSNSNFGGGGIATAIIDVGVLGPINIISGGVGYSTNPTVNITPNSPIGMSATAKSQINSLGIVTSIYFTNAGSGYTQAPQIIISSPIGISTGDYVFNEIISGQLSNTTARVKDWNAITRRLKVSIIDGSFALGETIVGIGTTFGGSNANYKMQSILTDDIYDSFANNDEIEEEADNIIDFSQSNPFGDY